MFKLVIFLPLLLLLSANVNAAQVIFGTGGSVMKVYDFPDNAMTKHESGKYVDVGYCYESFSIFFIPLWNYNERWCGYIGSDHEYLEIGAEDLNAMAKLANMAEGSGNLFVGLAFKPKLPFWDRVGGKILLGILGLFFLGGALENSEKTEDKEITR